MRYIHLGKTGLRVSQFALGTGMLGRTDDGTVSAEQANAVLQRYLEAGGNLINTSDAYQAGQSESLIGDVLGPHRDNVILATKYGRTSEPQPSPARFGNHRKAMVQAAEASLRRLKTDRIDLYLTHFDDEITPTEEIMRGFDDLVSAGKILYPGLSNFPAWRTAQAHTLANLRGWANLAVIEVEYNLLQRGADREILPLAHSVGLGVMGYSPLAAGMLLGSKPLTDAKAASRVGVPPESDPSLVLERLQAVAAEVGTDPGTVALAWVGAKGVIPILGARTPRHLSASLAAVQLSLSPDHMAQLDEVSAIPLGYPQALMSLLRQHRRQ